MKKLINTFYKLFLLALGLWSILIVLSAKAEVINPSDFEFLLPTDTIETLPEELPQTWVDVRNWDCSSYWANSYWKEWVCYTPKWAWTFNKNTIQSSSIVCTLDDNRVDNLIYVIKDLQLEYSKQDVMCIDIIEHEQMLKDLVNELFKSRTKTTVKQFESAKFIEFPAPTVKYITKTIKVKVCSQWTYDKDLDTCILPITWVR